MNHKNVKAISAPGKSKRLWKCVDCGTTGTLLDLAKANCTSFRPRKSDEQQFLDMIEGTGDFKEDYK